MKAWKGFLKNKFRFREMQITFVLFGLLVLVIYFLQQNVLYEGEKRILEPLAAETLSLSTADQKEECLILWEEDEMGLMGREMMEEVLGQMKIPYTSQKGEEEILDTLDQYRTVVLSMTHLNLLGESILDLIDWMEKGGNLMVLYPPSINGVFLMIANDLGIQSVGDNMVYVDEVFLDESFMISGGRESFKLPGAYESALQVYLLPECKVHLASSGEENAAPLIWSCEKELGRVVFCNLGHLEKVCRGFYSAGYSLMGDYCVWPVINGSAFYLDDFPAPLPEGENEYINRDYGMSIKDFHKQIWWNDIYNLANKYGIRYTGLAIEEYTDQVKAPFVRHEDTRDFEYYGSMLLDEGGEIGFHGYNHMPLCLTYSGRRNPSLKNWESYEDMVKGMEELQSFLSLLFPRERFKVYGPPSNILDQEGREMLAEEFPEITAIAGVYFSGEMYYEQEFEAAEDGIIETPRVISGYLFEEYEQLSAVSELNFHYVNSHFQHFGDVLTADGGGELGWEELSGRFLEYIDWLYTAAPDLRNLTGTEMAGAVQRYDCVEVIRVQSENELKLTLENFMDESWLLIRMNEKTPGKVKGGSIQSISGNLYLLKADASQVTIELK